MRCLEVNELLYKKKTVYFYLHHQFQTNREKEIDTQFQTTTTKKNTNSRERQKHLFSCFLFFNSFFLYKKKYILPLPAILINSLYEGVIHVYFKK